MFARIKETYRILSYREPHSGPEIQAVRDALADYIVSEGCSCCRNEEAHTEAKAKLARLLEVPAYKDGSGWDFYKFGSKRK